MLNLKLMREHFENALVLRITDNEPPSEAIRVQLIPKDPDGKYANPHHEDMWWAWQQSRKALMTEPLAQTPDLHAHQLLDHEGKTNGVFLGCPDRAICVQAKIPGETEMEVREFYSAETMKLLQAVHRQELATARPIVHCECASQDI